MDQPIIGFRPLAMEDLRLIHRWLNENPLVREFYGYGKETTYDQVCANYGPRIRGRRRPPAT